MDDNVGAWQDECFNCGARNSRIRKHCKKCGILNLDYEDPKKPRPAAVNSYNQYQRILEEVGETGNTGQDSHGEINAAPIPSDSSNSQEN